MMTLITFLVSAIKFGMVLLFGSTGETITEKSGHLNLGLPGIMCVGTACGCIAEAIFFDLVGGRRGMENLAFLAVLIPILATLIGGALMGLIFSFLTVTLHANQNVTGLAMTTLGVGISDFLIASVDGYKFTAGAKFFNTSLPFADDLGAFGKLFFSYGIMIYLSIAVAIATSLVLNRTKVGLHLRAVGENPATADAAGINVTKYRYVATCTGSAIAGLGGLMFVMDYLNGNWEYVIDAIGWLCVALVIFTTWKPVFGIFCSIVFGAFYVAAEYIPGISLASKEIFKMLPFLVTIIVLIMISVKNKKENQPPASLGQSYFREER
ncbi:MAG: ABC transporter permease [Clostridia bacterium]|nr:ABC transporter permease [Clostridia bacterium]